MRFIGKAVSVLLVAATIVSLAPGLLWAGAETPGGGVIPTNPNAFGTKVSGPVTIFYVLGNNLSCTGSQQEIIQYSVVMELTKGNTLLTFSGIQVPALLTTPKTVCFPGIADQLAFVQSLIAAEVIPTFFGATSPPLTFEFKSATAPSPTQSPNFGDTNPNTDSLAISLDVVIAVH